MKLQTTAALAAAFCMSTSSVLAKASTSVQLTKFTISVSSLSNAPGAPIPTVRFTSGSDYLEIDEETQDPLTYQYSILNAPGFFAASSSATTPARAGARTSISGDPFSSAGGSISASAFAYGTGGRVSTAHGSAVVGDDSAWAAFTLGPNTRLNISAFYEVTADIRGPSFLGAYEVAGFSAGLTLLPANGQPGKASFADIAGNVAHAGFYTDAPIAEEGMLKVTYAGSKTQATNGLFMAQALTSVVSNVPIPEPTSGVLLLAGLGVLALSRRRLASPPKSTLLA